MIIKKAKERIVMVWQRMKNREDYRGWENESENDVDVISNMDEDNGDVADVIGVNGGDNCDEFDNKSNICDGYNIHSYICSEGNNDDDNYDDKCDTNNSINDKNQHII